MNIYQISEDSTALNQIGYAIDTPQRIKLQMGLLRLSQSANADQLLFWGKILTNSQPYYIAVAIDFKGHFAFPHKKFFYSTDNFNFKQLPELDKFNQQKVDQFNILPFTGVPGTVLIGVQGQGQQKKQEQKKQQKAEDLESQEEVEKIIPKNYTQQDRLSYTIRAIQIDCQLVPKGSLKMITQHQIRYNNKFVPSKEISLKNFLHFRYPQTKAALENLESTKSIFCQDIFDSIQNQSFWSIQSNTKNDLQTVRSLLWPGYLSYVFTRRNTFGGIYYGNGIKNVDLPFYL